MKQFSLKEYLENPNRKIVTRDGRSVRILCTDRNHPTRPIITLVQNDKVENTYTYRENGSWLDCTSSPTDLFFAPEKKEGWINIYKIKSTVNPCISSGLQVYNTKEEAEAAVRGMSDYISTIKIQWEE